jgi:hypothetical protein
MSDPYPEVKDDESDLVPPQTGRNPDWPKKIRTLTAAELDRLTIDSAGRFYWDGKLVNYEPPQRKPSEDANGKRAEPLDPSALEVLDRANYELGENKESVESAPRRSHAADLSAVDLDTQRPVEPAADVRSEDLPGVATVPPGLYMPERLRLKLSFWQSLGAFIAALGIVAGASGLVANGFVAAHDWGCRAGLIESYCPKAPSAPRPPTRPDIPA